VDHDRIVERGEGYCTSEDGGGEILDELFQEFIEVWIDD